MFTQDPKKPNNNQLEPITMNLQTLTDSRQWEQHGVALPTFSIDVMREKTISEPAWIHFGAGNIFRGYIARLQQDLLEAGICDKGIIAVETFDFDIVDKIYKPYDNLALLVGLYSDGKMEKKIIASVAEAMKADTHDEDSMSRLEKYFTSPALQLVSFTITEKGYTTIDSQGQPLNSVKTLMENGPKSASHVMGTIAALLCHRFRNGAHPIAMVSMDNCSQNGDRLKSGVVSIAKAWEDRNLIETGFVRWLTQSGNVSFPWSMIDKITPRPAQEVLSVLKESGIAGMDPIVTATKTFIAPYVNAEVPEYLVVEDDFPNGRPPLEKAGVFFTSRDTVNKTERMKVTTCLNPLHTALAVFGCLLGYSSIAAEMKDPDLCELVRRIGYQEGMPVVVDPGIINPGAFIDQVVGERFPNPFIPDTPQRIATDTSQKIPIRFGETIKSYLNRPEFDVSELICIPLVLAAWLRYLMGVGDDGTPMAISPDPMLDDLQRALNGIAYDNPDSCTNQLQGIVSNPVLFGVDLSAAGLSDKVTLMFRDMLGGRGAVRNTLQKYLSRNQC